MNRIFRAICLILAISLINIQKGYCWRPIVRTGPAEGLVVDSVTKQPIEKVIVVASYWQTVPAIVEDHEKIFDSYVTITDKDGKFKIPAKTSFHFPPLLFIGSTGQKGRGVSFNHPLYLTVGSLQGGEYKLTQNPDGSENYYVELMGLGERFLGEDKKLGGLEVKKEMSEEEKKRRNDMENSFWSYLNGMDNGWYWLTLKEKNIPFNMEETFKVWDEIVDEILLKKYPDASLRETLKKAKENIRKKVGDEKQ